MNVGNICGRVFNVSSAVCSFVRNSLGFFNPIPEQVNVLEQPAGASIFGLGFDPFIQLHNIVLNLQNGQSVEALLSEYIAAIQNSPRSQQVLQAIDNNGNTLLQIAIQSAKLNIFQSVSSLYTEELDKEELKKMLMQVNENGMNLLAIAINNVGEDKWNNSRPIVFEAVLGLYNTLMAEDLNFLGEILQQKTIENYNCLLGAYKQGIVYAPILKLCCSLRANNEKALVNICKAKTRDYDTLLYFAYKNSIFQDIIFLYTTFTNTYFQEILEHEKQSFCNYSIINHMILVFEKEYTSHLLQRVEGCNPIMSNALIFLDWLQDNEQNISLSMEDRRELLYRLRTAIQTNDRKIKRA